MRHLLIALLVIPATLAAQTTVSVEASKKTTRTSETGSAHRRTIDYVDRVTLDIALAGDGPAELTCYFVARNIQTHALSYFGLEKQPVMLSRAPQKLTVQSEPLPYSQTKERDATADPKRGSLPFGWVVLLASDGKELGVKASSPDVLAWVRKNPPRLRSHSSP